MRRTRDDDEGMWEFNGRVSRTKSKAMQSAFLEGEQRNKEDLRLSGNGNGEANAGEKDNVRVD